VRIRLTPKGEEVAEVIDELYERHLKSIEKVGGLNDDAFEGLNRALGRLERFWVDQILYKL
jgi:DNA-binding MarR family transcriptional regulator